LNYVSKWVVAGSLEHVHACLDLIFIHLCTYCSLWFGIEEVVRLSAFAGCKDLQCESFAVVYLTTESFLHQSLCHLYTLSNVFECLYMGFHAYENHNTTFSNGSLGSRIDEERSEMR
jgi:hypothetical protein